MPWRNKFWLDQNPIRTYNNCCYLHCNCARNVHSKMKTCKMCVQCVQNMYIRISHIMCLFFAQNSDIIMYGFLAKSRHKRRGYNTSKARQFLIGIFITASSHIFIELQPVRKEHGVCVYLCTEFQLIVLDGRVMKME